MGPREEIETRARQIFHAAVSGEINKALRKNVISLIEQLADASRTGKGGRRGGRLAREMAEETAAKSVTAAQS